LVKNVVDTLYFTLDLERRGKPGSGGPEDKKSGAAIAPLMLFEK
jgi:hypothetical protein